MSARRILEKHSPAFLIIDANHDIIRFSGGGAGRYLEPSSGTAGLNLFSILKKPLRPFVRKALQQATDEPIVSPAIDLRIGRQQRTVRAIVARLP